MCMFTDRLKKEHQADSELQIRLAELDDVHTAYSEAQRLNKQLKGKITILLF